MEITKDNVHEFSKHYLDCENEETKATALTIIKQGTIDYDKETKAYLVNQYKVKWVKTFVCDCGVDDCPHVLALFMQLKIWNSERRAAEELST